MNFSQSAILWNNGNAKFQLMPLPFEAQVSPIFGIVADDFDGDDLIDLWVGGNFYGTKPQLGRYDASRGVYLKGTGDRNFESKPKNFSGIYVEGQVRDAVLIKSGISKKLLVGRNNANLLIFETFK